MNNDKKLQSIRINYNLYKSMSIHVNKETMIDVK